MIGEGREPKKDNDLFYTCSVIDYIARKTKNKRCLLYTSPSPRD